MRYSVAVETDVHSYRASYPRRTPATPCGTLLPWKQTYTIFFFFFIPVCQAHHCGAFNQINICIRLRLLQYMYILISFTPFSLLHFFLVAVFIEKVRIHIDVYKHEVHIMAHNYFSLIACTLVRTNQFARSTPGRKNVYLSGWYVYRVSYSASYPC